MMCIPIHFLNSIGTMFLVLYYFLALTIIFLLSGQLTFVCGVNVLLLHAVMYLLLMKIHN